MTLDLKTRIENMLNILELMLKGEQRLKSEGVDKPIVVKLHSVHVHEMVDIIRSLEAKVEAYTQLIKDITKDYEGLAMAADKNNLVGTAKDARETIAHITKILTKERLNENN